MCVHFLVAWENAFGVLLIGIGVHNCLDKIHSSVDFLFAREYPWISYKVISFEKLQKIILGLS